MQIDDIRKCVDNVWTETEATWKDDMSKKYRNVIVDKIDDLLKSMQSSCNQLSRASGDALQRLADVQE